MTFWENQLNDFDQQKLATARDQVEKIVAESDPNNLFAIIDLGSRAFRLIVYEKTPDGHVQTRIRLPLFHDFTPDRLLESGPQSCVIAQGIIRTIGEMLETCRVSPAHICAIGTEYFRKVSGTEMGNSFIADIEQTTGTPLRIISGDQEAVLAVEGLAFSYGDAAQEVTGLCAELGGGSLQLTRVLNGKATDERVSLELGVKTLIQKYGQNFEKARRAVRKQLEEHGWIRNAGDLYILGGTWFEIGDQWQTEGLMSAPSVTGRIRSDYRADQLNGYSVSRTDALHMLPDILEQKNGGAENRLTELQMAAMVLQEVLCLQEPSAKITLSSYGAREALLARMIQGKPITLTT